MYFFFVLDLEHFFIRLQDQDKRWVYPLQVSILYDFSHISSSNRDSHKTREMIELRKSAEGGRASHFTAPYRRLSWENLLLDLRLFFLITRGTQPRRASLIKVDPLTRRGQLSHATQKGFVTWFLYNIVRPALYQIAMWVLCVCVCVCSCARRTQTKWSTT